MKGGGCAAVALGVVGTFVVGLSIIGGAVDEEGDDEKGGLSAFGGSLNAKAVPEQYRKWVIKAGKVCPGVSSPLIAAQIEAESGWNPLAKSPAAARGLSQFIPGTWETWKVDADGGGASWRSGPDNIMTQAAYDCALMKQVKGLRIKGEPTRLMLAAYNAGPDAVRRYQGVPPYQETQQYVKRIMGLIPKYSAALRPEAKGGPFGRRVASYAKRWIGTPYAWGGGDASGPTRGIDHGSGTTGFDCSGLVMYAVSQASGGDITLPHLSQAQVLEGKSVKLGDIKVGDAIGFALHEAGYWDHIGIYIGGGQFVHAPSTGDVVKISSLHEPYYKSKPKKIRRYG
ncbi:NlpC/P60 family protein [Streptomyces sp. NPDC005900]|uniref:C40 family peptidase n=1 Tax=Streptomyces sp. NPDC005900 TaxID=3154569 RepID=UPI0033F3D470